MARNLFTILFFVASGVFIQGRIFGQSPQSINYQAVARDVSGNLITGPLTVRISIRQGSASGTVSYQETHSVTANPYGIFNLAIGQGSALTGNFSSIDWATGPYYAQVEINTGSSYVNLGAQQMLSVPYALFAARAATADNAGSTVTITGGQGIQVSGGPTNYTISANLGMNDLNDVNTAGVTNGQVLKWNGTEWTPANDQDNDAQTLSFNSGTGLLSISGGNSVTLPMSSGGDNWGSQVAQTTARLTGNGTSSSPLDIAQQGATSGQVLKWNGTSWAPAADNNTDAQTLSLSGNTLSISGGNSVTLPAGGGADNWGSQVAQTTARLTGNGTSGSPLDIAQQGATSGQVLKWNGTTWAPAADNNTTYTAGSGISISGTTINATDPSATNEIQTLSISGNQLSISGGNSVTLPTGADNWGTQVAQTAARLTGNGTSGSPLDIAQQGATNGQVLKWNGTSWAPATDNNTTYTAGSGISISGTTISATDASTTNEIQTLSLSGSTLSISGGNSVTLPTGADNWGTQVVQTTAVLSGNGTSGSLLTIAQQGATNGQVLKWNGATWAPASDNNTTYTAGSGISISGTTISAADASATNEIQTLSISGSTLSISGGNSVTLPTGADNWGTQVAQTNATLIGNGTSGNPLGIAQQGATNGQVLKWNGTTWAPAADNNTTYTAGSGISISGTTISAADASATNEIQTLSLSGNTLSLSNGGGSVNLTPVLNNAWNIGGNLGTNASTDFIGTVDNQSLNFRANNQKSGKIGLPGDESTFFGYQAGENDDGTNNQSTFFGFQTGRYNYNADENTAVGYKALLGSMGSYNTAMGASAMLNNTSGQYNAAFGRMSLLSNLSGSENTAVGYSSMQSNTSGNNNIAVGSGALYNNSTGSRNIAIGNAALLAQSFNNSNNNWFSDNVAIGFEALYSNEPTTPLNEGRKNTAVGNFSLRSNTTGHSNCALGFESAYSVTSGTFNTALGLQALHAGTSGGSNTAIGAEALFANKAGAQATAVGRRAMYNANNSTTFFINYNVAVGYEALFGSSAPGDNTGNANTALGHTALRNVSSGSNNTAAGAEALRGNITGSDNTAVGKHALFANVAGSKATAVGFEALRYANSTATPYDLESVAIGYQALRGDIVASLNTGNRNTGVGFKALMENSVQNDNTAVGYMALALNPGTGNSAFGSEALKNGSSNSSCAFGYRALTLDDGTDNVAVGFEALKTKTSGNSNTAVGSSALATCTSGDGNTALGTGAAYLMNGSSFCSYFGANARQSPNTTTYTNSTAVGYDASITASNQVRVGNIWVTSIGGYANWSNVSDGRFKKDVRDDVPGLDFVTKLRPVTYHVDVTGLARHLGEGEFGPNHRGEPDATIRELERKSREEKEKILYSGFIAQEVEKAAQELGYDFSGVDRPQNEHSLYGLRYAEFVVPLVKAVQEQQKIIQDQKAEIESLKKTMESSLNTLSQRIEALQKQLSASSASNP